jgi:GTPase SAR1 family protein
MPITLSSTNLPTDRFEAYKIVILGSTGVGKTSLLNKASVSP